MIELRNVNKFYGKKENRFTALSNISVSIKKGDTVAIVGKSGSGKSTLMHIMSGLERQDSGQVLIDGKDIQELSQKELDHFRSKEMSFIFQSFFIEANQTCYQNISLPLEISKIPLKKRKVAIKNALEAVELSEKIYEKAGNLSGGQKQRLAIARAIVSKPKIIFADEPTGNLDSTTGEKIIRLLFALNKQLGCTVVLVTHDKDLASRCKSQITLKDGLVVEPVAAKVKT